MDDDQSEQPGRDDNLAVLTLWLGQLGARAGSDELAADPPVVVDTRYPAPGPARDTFTW